jgi:hypothetical protein
MKPYQAAALGAVSNFAQTLRTDEFILARSPLLTNGKYTRLGTIGVCPLAALKVRRYRKRFSIDVAR